MTRTRRGPRRPGRRRRARDAVVRRRSPPGAALVAAAAAVLSARAVVADGVPDVDARREGRIDAASTVRLAADVVERLLGPHRDDDGAGGASPAPTDEGRTGDDDGTVSDRNVSYDGSDLISWINSNGGFVHPNVRIGSDATGSYRGVFVRDAGDGEGGIKDDEIIARIPWDLIVKPKDYSKNIYYSCNALREMHRQFVLGDKSKYAPYINYLKNQPRGRMPEEWTEAGKGLLSAILGHGFEDDNEWHGLPPYHHKKSYFYSWLEECGEEDSDLARAAFYQLTSRDEDTLMVPFYDMHNHSNDPKKLNVIPIKPAQPGRAFLMRATRDVDPGEQLLISYNRCHACWHDPSYGDCASHSHYGTPELFDVFGFVEDLPHRWAFNMELAGERGGTYVDDVNFCLEGSDDGRLLVTFGNNHSEDEAAEMPLEANIVFFGRQLARLGEVESSMRGDAGLRASMPGHEWDAAWRYHEALMTSMSAAVLASTFADEADAHGDGEDNEAQGGHEEGSGDEEGGEDEEGGGDGWADDSEDEGGDGSEDHSGDEEEAHDREGRGDEL